MPPPSAARLPPRTTEAAAGCGRRRAAPSRVRVQPSSGASARPVANSMTQPCSGQATALSLHDALRQRAAAMRTAVDQRENLVFRGAEHRDRRRIRRGLMTRRAPRRGMSSRQPISTQLPSGIGSTGSLHLGERAVFMRGGAGRALGPGVLLHEALREQEPPVQRAPRVRRPRRSGGARNRCRPGRPRARCVRDSAPPRGRAAGTRRHVRAPRPRCATRARGSVTRTSTPPLPPTTMS